MEIHQFIREKQNDWKRFETLLAKLDSQGLEVQSADTLKQVLSLYRRVTSDLNQAQTYYANADLLDYLHQLASRGYALIYSQTENVQVLKNLKTFFTATLPAEIFRQRAYVLTAVGVFLLGAIFGGLAVLFDGSAEFYLFPPEFSHLHDPTGHAGAAESTNSIDSADKAAHFSAMLMAHNTKVAMLAFALGLTAGVGTVIMLFYNGIILGGAVANFLKAGETAFVLAWLSPHGVIEIPAILLAGAAGFMLGRAIIAPGNMTVPLRMMRMLPAMIHILVGVVVMLVIAGCIEGSLSQMNQSYVPRGVKVAFAVCLLTAELCYVFLLGPRAAAAAATKTPSI